ncbi:MAG: 5'/3'-nucleotidase SurE [Chloroflexota bacterium]
MHVLVTNDDGILADGLWALVEELQRAGRVTVVAPGTEQSSVGTAVTLRQVLRVQKVKPRVAGVETYAVDGTPSDSVFLALGKLVPEKVDLVISGINLGLNLGEDIHISGTVAAALQGYLLGYPAMATSTVFNNPHSLEITAGVTALLAQKIVSSAQLPPLLLNVNVPDLSPGKKIGGVRVTRLARESHLNSVDEGNDGWRKYYWLVRREYDETERTHDPRTDIGAIKQGNISLTSLYPTGFTRPTQPYVQELAAGLGKELQERGWCS